jgi:hypothetical protein
MIVLLAFRNVHVISSAKFPLPVMITCKEPGTDTTDPVGVWFTVSETEADGRQPASIGVGDKIA